MTAATIAIADGEEFDDTFPSYPRQRSESEHPEQAYRRGYQQGAYAVTKAMVEAGLLDKRAASNFDLEVTNWRYGKRQRKRELFKDRAPELIITPEKSA